MRARLESKFKTQTLISLRSNGWSTLMNSYNFNAPCLKETKCKQLTQGFKKVHPMMATSSVVCSIFVYTKNNEV